MKISEIYTLYCLAAKQLDVIQDYQNKDVCTSCGGKCCKNSPGINTPNQFGAPDRELLFKNITSALHSGRYTVDWWETDGRLPQTYFIRPSEKGKEFKLRDPSYGGECNFLTDKGCELNHDERPTQCTTLEPGIESCEQHGSKLDIAKLWRPYQKEIRYALEYADRIVNPLS